MVCEIANALEGYGKLTYIVKSDLEPVILLNRGAVVFCNSDPDPGNLIPDPQLYIMQNMRFINREMCPDIYINIVYI